MTKILIVDDIVDNVKLLSYNLSDEGWKTVSAYSGLQALEVAKTENPDLILLDIMMPDMDGIEVCRRLKQDPELRSIPVILVSAKDEDDDVIEGLDAGAQDYITKPYSWPIVAARVRSATRIKKALDTIEEINRQLDKAKKDAESATAAKSEFLANMSHEIRTPMTAILGFSENLLDKNTSDQDRADAIHTILRNGKYLLEIINDILDLSKIEAHKIKIEHLPYSPIKIIAHVQSLMEARAAEKGLVFNFEYLGVIPETINTDPTRLRQILFNLIGNAIKFTPEGGVRMVTRLLEPSDLCETHQLQFDVIDTGIGIAKNKIRKLFKGFAQADSSTTRKFGGTGLGLVISKSLAEMLGGTVELVSTEAGVGSVFRAIVATGSLENVKLLENPHEATVVVSEHPTKTNIEQTLDCCILLAEDSPDNQRLITYILTKAGAQVTTVENGKLAVERALEARSLGKPYDIILMDMQMPCMDGYEATGHLRNRDYDGPIIALTANAMASDRDKCLRSGCDEYASKPINRVKLIELIQRMLDKSHKTQPV